MTTTDTRAASPDTPAVTAVPAAFTPLAGPAAIVLADSISREGVRLMTFETVMHRFVLSENNTHKVVCLAGDVELWFDQPHDASRGRFAVSKVRVDEFHDRWHTGTTHTRSRKGRWDLSVLEDDREYTATELAAALNCKSGRIYITQAARIHGLPHRRDKHGRVLVSGGDFRRWYEDVPTVSYPQKDRLSAMSIRCLDEETGEFTHTRIKDVWQSGEQETFTVEFEDGYSITTTEDHRFFTDRGWMTLADASGLRRLASGEIAWDADAPLFAVNGQSALDDSTWLAAQRDAGKTQSDIAEHLGLTRKQVEYAFHRLGLSRTRNPRPVVLDDPEWLLDRRRRGDSSQTIADELGVARDVVKNAFQRHDIPYDPAVTLAGRSAWNKGLRYSNPRLKGRKKTGRVLRGPEHPSWKGGVTSDRQKIAAWTSAVAPKVHEKFGHRCQVCMRNRELVAHHVVPVVKDVALAYEFDNLITLCAEHHRRIHSRNLEDSFAAALAQGADLSVFADVEETADYPEWKQRPIGNVLRRRWARITRITYAGVQMTYDVEVEGPWHNFVADGVVVHNCKSASSSRAIPITKQIEMLRANPAYPVKWASEQSGMQGGDALDTETQTLAQHRWRLMMEESIRVALDLRGLGVHKSLVNRLLEPFSWIRVVQTATAWDNFLDLRDHADAQPEFGAVARLMREARDASTPVELAVGRWHLPYVAERDREEVTRRLTADDTDLRAATWARAPHAPNDVALTCERILAQVSAARCARTSFLTNPTVDADGHVTEEARIDIDKDFTLVERLLGARPRHWSPFEHQATPWAANRQSEGIWFDLGSHTHRVQTGHLPRVGNLLGWRHQRTETEALLGEVTYR